MIKSIGKSVFLISDLFESFLIVQVSAPIFSNYSLSTCLLYHILMKSLLLLGLNQRNICQISPFIVPYITLFFFNKIIYNKYVIYIWKLKKYNDPFEFSSFTIGNITQTYVGIIGSISIVIVSRKRPSVSLVYFFIIFPYYLKQGCGSKNQTSDKCFDQGYWKLLSNICN